MFIRNPRWIRLLPPILLALGFVLFLLGITRGLAAAAFPQGSAPPTGIAAHPPPPAPIPPQVWLNLLRPESPQHAAPSGGGGITLNINLTDNFLGGRAPLPATVYLTHTRSSQIIGTAHAIPIPDVGGYFFYTALTTAAQPNDLLWARQADLVISLTVPTLTALPNAAENQITGSAPPAQPLRLTYLPFDDPQGWQTHALTVPQSGAYSLTLPLRPRDEGYALWGYGTAHQAYTRFYAAFVQAQVDGSSIEIYSLPYASINITAKLPSGGMTALSATANGQGVAILGWEAFSLRGLPDLQAGQTITAAVAGESITLTLPALTALPVEGGALRGETLPGERVQALRCAGALPQNPYDYAPLANCTPLGAAAATADVTGAYTLPLGWQPAEYGAAFVDLPNGHQAFVRFAAPFLEMRLYDDAQSLQSILIGQISPPNTPLTITVRNADGLLKTLAFARSDDLGRLFDNGTWTLPDLRFAAGDSVNVTNAAGQMISIGVPTLTAQADLYTGEVLGVAPAGARLTVTAVCEPYGKGGGWGCPPFAGVSQVVTASVDGAYQALFPSYELPYWVDVAWRAASNHTVTRRVWATVPCPPRPLQVFVGGDRINFGAAAAQCNTVPITLSVRDPSAAKPKYWREFKGGVWDVLLNNREYTPHPILILPGDVLQVSWLNETWEWTVPTLTVTFDAAAQAVRGQAPPLAALQVTHATYASSRWITITAAADGSFYLPLPENWGAQPGDTFEVTTVVQGVTAAAVAVWRQIDLTLYDADSLEVNLSPLTPFTVTQWLADGTLAAIQTGLTSNYGQRYVYLGSAWQPGMRVQVQSAPFTREWTIPQIVVWADAQTGAIRGSAPPFAQLQLDSYFSYDSGAWKTVTLGLTANADGAFEFYPAAQPFIFAHGTVAYSPPDAELTLRTYFITPGFSKILLDDGIVGARATQSGATMTITLHSGSEVFTQTGFSGRYSGEVQVDFERRLYPADVLTLLQHGRVLATLVVPQLQGVLHRPSGVLHGTAPAGTRVEAWFGTPDDSFWHSTPVRYALADSAGDFVLDVSDVQSV